MRAMYEYLKIRLGLGKEEGVTAIEYGLLAALIALVIIIAVIAVGTKLSGTFDNVATHLRPE